MSIINKYLKTVPEPQKSELERISQLIKATVPEAEEAITYGMPGYRYKGKYLIAFASFKDHMSVFPGAAAIEELTPKLIGYKTSKGTAQFTLEQPLPEGMVEKMLQVRIAEIDK